MWWTGGHANVSLFILFNQPGYVTYSLDLASTYPFQLDAVFYC